MLGNNKVNYKKKRVRHNYMTLLFLTNTLMVSLLCLGIFFSLPAQEFFRGQGKIKVGTGTEKMKPESTKITDG